MSENEKLMHTLSMQNRGSLALTGITNVESFNEEEIVATSDWGELMIKGAALNVEVLDLQSGELKISGKITALVYTEKIIKSGFFRRAFS